MAHNGAAKTSVRAISKLTDGTRGRLTHHYAGKDALLAESFEHLIVSVSDEIRAGQSGLSAEDALKYMAKALFNPPLFDFETRVAFLAFWDAARYSKVLQRIHKKHYDAYKMRVAGMFEAAASQRHIQINSEHAALGLIALIDGFWLGLSLDPAMLPIDAVIAICDNYIDTQLGQGILRDDKKADEGDQSR